MAVQLVGRWEDIVVRNAKKEADRIKSEAHQRASLILEEARKEAERIVEEYKQRAFKRMELERQRKLGLAHLKVNEELLNAEHEILDKVFSGLRKEIEEKLKDEKVLKPYLEKVVNEVFSSSDFEKPKVYVNPNEFEIVKQLLKDKVSNIVKSNEVKYGIVVEDEERGFKVYNTLDTRLEVVKREILERIRNLW